MKVFTREACDLLVMCIERAQEIYGEELPGRIEKRIVEEIVMLNDIGFERDFLELASLLDEVVPDPADRLNIGVSDGAGAFLTAYLCGLSPYNPVEYLEGRFYPEIYHDTVVRRMQTGHSVRLTLNVSLGIYQKLKAKKQWPPHVTIRATKNLTLLEGMLETV